MDRSSVVEAVVDAIELGSREVMGTEVGDVEDIGDAGREGEVEAVLAFGHGEAGG